jgi:hypothetical protein
MMEIQTETKIVRFIELDGFKFYSDKKGYWISSHKFKGKPKRLHIYVWEKYNGEIPDGFHVHHIDHNTDNNEIENLMILERSEHLILHGQNERNRVLASKNIVKYGVPAAREWHGTAKGNEWHRAHYETSLALLHKKRITLTCVVCGDEFSCDACKTNAKYCSNLCKSRGRRRAEMDAEQRVCSVCGDEYTISKYSKGQTCSRECRAKLRSERLDGKS